MLPLINYIFIKILNPSIQLFKSRVYLSWFKVDRNNILSLNKANIISSRVYIVGENNLLDAKNSLISNTVINISGTNNLVKISENVKLRNGNIIIKGNNCSLTIAKDTTFGGIRIINVGKYNSINIGENCLFSDQIEIWASDSHAIYSNDGKWINKEKPVKIGNNVWIGSRVVILKGVSIADGAIIGMGTLLTKNVNKKTIVAGSPLKVIKENISWTLEYPDSDNINN